MKRKDFTIREDQVESLKKQRKTTGICMSEIVRQAIDLYFVRERENNEREKM